jgi:N-methylhydantoinase B
MGALSQVIPDQVTGEPKIGANHTYVGGWDTIRKKAFLSYDYPAGGTPAFFEGDGSNAVLAFNSGDVVSIHPIEILENKQPLRIECIELRVNSGGAGRQRGGLGFRKGLKILSENAQLSILSERNIIPNNGVSGGYSAARNNGVSGGYSAARNAFSVIREGKEILPFDIPGKVTGFPLKYGDIVMMETNGGGGFGDPLTRDPELVRQDVLEGYVSEEGAKENFGVIIVGGTVDLKKTQELRERQLSKRKHIRVIASDSDKYDERGCRLCPISSSLASQLGVIHGELIEYVARAGFPLRAWIKVVDHLTDDSSPLGPRGRKMLKVKDGDLVEIRPLSRFYCNVSA